MATTFEASLTAQKVVRINPIPVQMKELQVISCDSCDGKASFDVYFDGVITGVNVLKRYCDDCVKLVTQ